MTEHEWKEPMNIEDGKHSGEITKVEERHDPYEYTDIFIKLDDVDVEMRYGCPTLLSENSKLGRLMQIFGVNAVPNTKTDPEAVLVGKRAVFMTLTKKNKEGKDYSEIIVDSIKPEIITQKVE